MQGDVVQDRGNELYEYVQLTVTLVEFIICGEYQGNLEDWFPLFSVSVRGQGIELYGIKDATKTCETVKTSTKSDRTQQPKSNEDIQKTCQGRIQSQVLLRRTPTMPARKLSSASARSCVFSGLHYRMHVPRRPLPPGGPLPSYPAALSQADAPASGRVHYELQKAHRRRRGCK